MKSITSEFFAHLKKAVIGNTIISYTAPILNVFDVNGTTNYFTH